MQALVGERVRMPFDATVLAASPDGWTVDLLDGTVRHFCRQELEAHTKGRLPSQPSPGWKVPIWYRGTVVRGSAGQCDVSLEDGSTVQVSAAAARRLVVQDENWLQLEPGQATQCGACGLDLARPPKPGCYREAQPAVKLDCGHLFHAACLAESSDGRCPSCDQPYRPRAVKPVQLLQPPAAAPSSAAPRSRPPRPQRGRQPVGPRTLAGSGPGTAEAKGKVGRPKTSSPERTAASRSRQPRAATLASKKKAIAQGRAAVLEQLAAKGLRVGDPLSVQWSHKPQSKPYDAVLSAVDVSKGRKCLLVQFLSDCSKGWVGVGSVSALDGQPSSTAKPRLIGRSPAPVAAGPEGAGSTEQRRARRSRPAADTTSLNLQSAGNAQSRCNLEDTSPPKRRVRRTSPGPTPAAKIPCTPPGSPPAAVTVAKYAKKKKNYVYEPVDTTDANAQNDRRRSAIAVKSSLSVGSRAQEAHLSQLPDSGAVAKRGATRTRATRTATQPNVTALEGNRRIWSDEEVAILTKACNAGNGSTSELMKLLPGKKQSQINTKKHQLREQQRIPQIPNSSGHERARLSKRAPERTEAAQVPPIIGRKASSTSYVEKLEKENARLRRTAVLQQLAAKGLQPGNPLAVRWSRSKTHDAVLSSVEASKGTRCLLVRFLSDGTQAWVGVGSVSALDQADAAIVPIGLRPSSTVEVLDSLDDSTWHSGLVVSVSHGSDDRTLSGLLFTVTGKKATQVVGIQELRPKLAPPAKLAASEPAAGLPALLCGWKSKWRAARLPGVEPVAAEPPVLDWTEQLAVLDGLDGTNDCAHIRSADASVTIPVLPAMQSDKITGSGSPDSNAAPPVEPNQVKMLGGRAELCHDERICSTHLNIDDDASWEAIFGW